MRAGDYRHSLPPGELSSPGGSCPHLALELTTKNTNLMQTVLRYFTARQGLFRTDVNCSYFVAINY